MNRLFRLIVLSLFAIILASCGRNEPTHNNVVSVDSDLERFIQSFEEYMEVDASYVSASFASLDAKTMGNCNSWSDGGREIKINIDFWPTLSEIGKEQLMYHELGHCVFDLTHEDRTVVDKNGNTVYGSIMNTYFFGESWAYATYQQQYKEALKSRTLLQF